MSRWHNQQQIDDYDAVILGVAALGSFFCKVNPHPNEEVFVQRSQSILDGRGHLSSPDTATVAAWILRTLYLRLTTRPNSAWLASATTMHMVEATGLHKDLHTIATVLSKRAPRYVEATAEADTRRRLFWVARALNIIISYEYGRSRVEFDIITSQKPVLIPHSFTHQIIDLACALPSDVIDPDRHFDPPSGLVVALGKVSALSPGTLFIHLLKADVAFATYRRLRLMSLTDAHEVAPDILLIGGQAVEAAKQLCGTPWWNLATSPFQFLCIVLTMNNTHSLKHVATVMELFVQLLSAYDTHMVREAYEQASKLIELSRRHTEKNLQTLTTQFISSVYPSTTARSPISSPSLQVPDSQELPFEWDLYLNPNLVLE